MFRKRDYVNEKLSEMRKAKEGKRLAEVSPDYPAELPHLRRRIVIIDYDFEKTVHVMDLLRTNRVDCYKAVINGKIWKSCIGWSKVLEGLRKSFVRVKSCH